MNTASLELCKELHDLSGWDDTVWHHWKDKLYTSRELRGQTMSEDFHSWPAYDLGYLIRKLPEIRLETWHNGQVVIKHYTANGVPGKLERKGEVIKVEADTPEDAAAKLAIQLFKQGILTKEQS